MTNKQAEQVMGANVTKIAEVKRPLNVTGKKVDVKTGIGKHQLNHTGVVVTTKQGNYIKNFF